MPWAQRNHSGSTGSTFSGETYNSMLWRHNRYNQTFYGLRVEMWLSYFVLDGTITASPSLSPWWRVEETQQGVILDPLTGSCRSSTVFNSRSVSVCFCFHVQCVKKKSDLKVNTSNCLNHMPRPQWRARVHVKASVTCTSARKGLSDVHECLQQFLFFSSSWTHLKTLTPSVCNKQLDPKRWLLSEPPHGSDTDL